MKQGRTLTALAQELIRQKQSIRDFIADTRELQIQISPRAETVATQPLMLTVGAHGDYPINEHTHNQLAGRIGIPAKYYDRMRTEAPALLKANVEHWFQHTPERRMVRTLDGRARAFLSDRYRPLDNYDLAEAVLPVLREADGIQIASCEVTESRLYIKATFPRIQGEVKKGDVVQSGIVVTNSEIGLSSLRIEPLIYRLVCLNGMICADFGTKRYHIGRNADSSENAYELYRDETLAADDKAFWMKARDTVRASLDQVQFQRILQRVQAAAQEKPVADPVAAVEVLGARHGFTEHEHNSVLKHLLSGGDLSRWGVVNAVTAASQDVTDYDRATELERLGGVLLVLPRTEWSVIADRAAA